MDYVIAVQTPAYALSSGCFATESAFGEHLKELRRSIGDDFRLVLLAPHLDEREYKRQKTHFVTFESERDAIAFVPAYPAAASFYSFWLCHALPLLLLLNRVMARTAIVHSGLSTDVRRPMLLFVNIVGRLHRRPVIFIVDIDFRRHASQQLQTGEISVWKYLLNRLITNVFKESQLRLAIQSSQLVLLKSQSMVDKFGKGLPHVKNFFDAVHTDNDILSDVQTEARASWLRREDTVLKLCYFGRLVPSKGVDRMIDAIKLARDQGSRAVLTVIGDGPLREVLARRAGDCNLQDQVRFVPQVPYGRQLFELLQEQHVTLAAPVIEDTPRAAFDSMARGLPLIAFDISYFRDLAELSNAIALAKWPSPAALAERIIELDGNRERLAVLALRGIEFARLNTQQIWLNRRAEWTRGFAESNYRWTAG
ncbi:glycosyltransferase family 4 protein [Bradyrhizobium liaoningense]|uniref:glycosyltransferase n=1 Tax=Bradyrhizobium liaoningense TaxID=43992 RepID=UPI001BAB3960|nr:glycosyltransferase [Bradyrhizobium liaoningense]MBR0737666.1 glycosyltransferase family 4 protein [Bradyrhizobium liaoningense]